MFCLDRHGDRFEVKVRSGGASTTDLDFVGWDQNEVGPALPSGRGPGFHRARRSEHYWIAPGDTLSDLHRWLCDR